MLLAGQGDRVALLVWATLRVQPATGATSLISLRGPTAPMLETLRTVLRNTTLLPPPFARIEGAETVVTVPHPLDATAAAHCSTSVRS